MYYVFIGDIYYPDWGINDLKDQFPSLDEARAFVKGAMFNEGHKWAQIVFRGHDLKLVVIEEGQGSYVD